MKYKETENIEEPTPTKEVEDKKVDSMENVCEALMHVVEFRLNLIKNSIEAIEQALEDIKKLHETNN